MQEELNGGFTNVCYRRAQAMAQQEDERERVRREKLDIDEMRSLVAEMIDAVSTG